MSFSTAMLGSEVRIIPTSDAASDLKRPAAKIHPAKAAACAAGAETPRGSRKVERGATEQQQGPPEVSYRYLKSALLAGLLLVCAAAVHYPPGQPVGDQVPPMWDLATALCYAFVTSVLIREVVYATRAYKAYYTPRSLTTAAAAAAAAQTVCLSPLAAPFLPTAARTGTRTVDETHSAAGAAEGESKDVVRAVSAEDGETEEPQEDAASPSQATARVNLACVADGDGEKPQGGATDTTKTMVKTWRYISLEDGGPQTPTAQDAGKAGRTALPSGDVAEHGSASPAATAAKATVTESQPKPAASASAAEESSLSQYSHSQDLDWGRIGVTATQDREKGVKVTVNLKLKPKARRHG